MPHNRFTVGCGSLTMTTYKYVGITANQTDNKSNPNSNPITTQHAIVNIQLYMITCPT